MDQGRVADHHSVGITAKFCTGSAVLQIIFPIVFGHPRTFNKWIQESVVKMFSKALPSIPPWLEKIHLFARSDRLHGFPVEFDAIKRISVAASVVHVKLSIIIGEECRIPTSDFKGIDQRFPSVAFGIGAHPQGEVFAVGRAENQHGITNDSNCRSA